MKHAKMVARHPLPIPEPIKQKRERSGQALHSVFGSDYEVEDEAVPQDMTDLLGKL